MSWKLEYYWSAHKVWSQWSRKLYPNLKEALADLRKAKRMGYINRFRITEIEDEVAR